MSETVISIKDLSKSFGDHEVLRKIDIDVHSGEVICIVAVSYTHLTLPTSDLV